MAPAAIPSYSPDLTLSLSATKSLLHMDTTTTTTHTDSSDSDDSSEDDLPPSGAYTLISTASLAALCPSPYRPASSASREPSISPALYSPYTQNAVQVSHTPHLYSHPPWRDSPSPSLGNGGTARMAASTMRCTPDCPSPDRPSSSLSSGPKAFPGSYSPSAHDVYPVPGTPYTVMAYGMRPLSSMSQSPLPSSLLAASSRIRLDSSLGTHSLSRPQTLESLALSSNSAAGGRDHLSQDHLAKDILSISDSSLPASHLLGYSRRASFKPSFVPWCWRCK
ncbi:hypothetical protein BASA61_010050 [Batrachochytrium salamandrivorans]|nr:hypothetical protein BASA61_010050 [Batrachochytrium salamandrivorans]